MTKLSLNASEITACIKEKIQNFEPVPALRQEGTIIGLSDGIVRIYGLDGVQFGEQLAFEDQQIGLALNLERDSVGAVVLGSVAGLSEGQSVRGTGKMLETPVGEALLGRVVNALGQAIDAQGPIQTPTRAPVEAMAPGVIWRQPVSEPLQTGIKAIDCMVPIGRGQRELIIGDRQTGKTTIAIDTIINQKNTGVKCIYVSIGQKTASVAAIVRQLESYGAMKHTIVVAATASEPAALQFIAPYVGCAMGEYFRDRGEDALIIYDDLSKHAWAYRQISLLLKRPPGREAYPGDVFYLHSRLLERASRVSAAYVEKQSQGAIKGRTGSLSALPIIETQAGDVSAFVPTNVISITDGQIYLEAELFNAGVRPAINPGLSVSRVGGVAQTKIIKRLGGGMRIALAQYRELAEFAQLASDLDAGTAKQLGRGQRAVEILKQKPLLPMRVSQMALSLFAIDQGYLDDVPIKSVLEFEKSLQEAALCTASDLLDLIDQEAILSEAISTRLIALIQSFKSNWIV